MDVLERAEPAAKPALRVIDCDVHPYVNSIKELYPYMPDDWRQRFIRKGADVAGRGDNKSFRVLNPNGTSLRRDARPPCGGMAGSDPGYIVEHLFRQNGIESGVLNCIQAGALNILAQADESIVLNAAFNDYFIHEWMPVDPGLKFAMTVPIADPLASAEEIRRVGQTQQIVAVSLPTLDLLMGNRYYYPIYAAAQEMGLPILVHVTGTEGTYSGAPSSAGGIADSFAEKYSTTSQYAQTNLASLVFNGTFERFPELKFVFVEYGFLWLLPLLWKMDHAWRSLRHEVPWVKKSPIEYIHDRCRFTTQPLEEPAEPGHLDQMMSMMGYDQLCFSTDYPHWDNDMPGNSLRSLPETERSKVFHGNAAATFRI